MGNFMAKMNKIQQIRFSAGLILVGLILAVIGGIFFFSPKDDLIETTAEIMEIQEEYDAAADMTSLFAWVRYTVDGVEYEGSVGCSSSDKTGDTMEIAYRANDPGTPMNTGGNVISLVIAALGLLAAVFGITKLVKVLKTKTSDMNPMDKVDRSKASPETVEAIRNNTEEEKEYYFHYCGKLNQSYVMETPGRMPVYKADCIKFPMLKPYTYDFVNCLTGETKTHEVTHTTTVRYNSGSGPLTGFMVPACSAFDVDGENVWECIGKNGYSMESHLDGIKMNFDILHYGVKVGELKLAGTNILKDGADSKLGEIPGTGLYRVFCKESDIPMAFLCAFCVSRVEFF